MPQPRNAEQGALDRVLQGELLAEQWRGDLLVGGNPDALPVALAQQSHSKLGWAAVWTWPLDVGE